MVAKPIYDERPKHQRIFKSSLPIYFVTRHLTEGPKKKTTLYAFILNSTSAWSMTQTFLKFKPLHPVDRGHSYPALWKPETFPQPVFSHKIQYSKLFMSLQTYRSRSALSFLPCAATTTLLVTDYSLVIAVHGLVWSCKVMKFQL